MEGDDDMDSLFAGMDFVNPMSFTDEAIPPAETGPVPLELHDLSKQSQNSSRRTSSVESSVKPDVDHHKLKSETSIDSILAAYDSVPAKQPQLTTSPSFSKQTSSDTSKPVGVRRKRRSVKIGYGRSIDDAEDAKSTIHDEIRSNGSASVDDHSNGLSETYGSDSHGDDGLLWGTAVNDSGSHEALKIPFDGIEDNQKDDGTNVEDPCHHSVEERSSSFATSKVDASAEEGGQIQQLEVKEAETVSSSSGEELPNLDRVVLHAEDKSAEHAPSTEASDQNVDEVPDLHIKIPSGVSIEEKVTFIKNAVAHNTELIQQRVSAVSQARKAAAQKRRQAAEGVSAAALKKKEVEEEIQAACESEDFEKAESLNDALADAERTHEDGLKRFRDSEIEYDKYTSKMHDVIQMHVANEEEGSRLLKQLGLDASEIAKNLKENTEEKGKKQMEELTAEEESVKLRKKKILLEVRVVEEAKSELNNTISSSVETEAQEKTKLVEERGDLQKELDALLEAVRQKEAQIAAHDKMIGDLEEKISRRVSGFEKESQDLETKLQNLMAGVANLETEFNDVIAKKVQVESDISMALEEEKKLIEISNTVRMEAEKLEESLNVRKSVAQAALCSKEKMLSLASQENQIMEDAQSLKNQSSSLRTSLQELASEKVKLQQELLSANQQMISMDKRGPEIEAEKKLAAASRNFKEAGRLANEAKALLSNKEKVASELNRIKEDLQRLDNELESKMSELTNLENQLLEKEKEAARARCERLRLLAATTRDERDAAAELEDFEEAENLHLEAEAADKEADELQKVYDFKGETYVRMSSKAIRSVDSEKVTDDLETEAENVDDVNEGSNESSDSIV